MGFRAQRSTHPTKLLLPSQLPIPDRGDGGAPGGGILSPSRPVTARHHVCEAWAIPSNRDGASRRSTVTVLGPLRARLRSCLRLACAGDLCFPGVASGQPRVPNLPGTAYEPRPRRHLPLHFQETLLESAPHERDNGFVSRAHQVVNANSS